jgi:hypothetical protein
MVFIARLQCVIAMRTVRIHKTNPTTTEDNRCCNNYKKQP